jgi:hypothetical protein
MVHLSRFGMEEGEELDRDVCCCCCGQGEAVETRERFGREGRKRDRRRLDGERRRGDRFGKRRMNWAVSEGEELCLDGNLVLLLVLLLR